MRAAQKRLFALGCIGLALAAMWAARAECNTPLLHVWENREFRHGLSLLTQLEEWEAQLGPAETVERARSGRPSGPVGRRKWILSPVQSL
jgi:hypothetical protein